MSDQKVLFVISACYPYGKGEEFVLKELKELSTRFHKIVVFPLNISGQLRWTPDNVETNLVLAEYKRSVSFKNYLTALFTILRVLGLEMMRSGHFWYMLKKCRKLTHELVLANEMSRLMYNECEKYKQTNKFYYSVWMDEGALIMALLKSKSKLSRFVFRLHGYDLFDERREGGYMPFRVFNFRHASKVFVLSQAGYNYIKQKNIYPYKLLVNYSGLYSHGANPFDPTSTFTLVSCSNIIPIKRVRLIAQALTHVNVPVRWVHFGEGSLLGELQAIVATLPDHISCELKGHVKNEELIAFYKATPVHLFIHVSETEGLGMAIVEAQSFGIPALACNVGGVSEVVNEKTGILVDPAISPLLLAQQIIQFKSSEMNTQTFRNSVQARFNEKFNAEINYAGFCNEIINANE